MLSFAVQEESLNCWYFIFFSAEQISFSAELSTKKCFITLGPV